MVSLNHTRWTHSSQAALYFRGNKGAVPVSTEFTVRQLLYLDHDFHQYTFSRFPSCIRHCCGFSRAFIYLHTLFPDAWTDRPTRWNHSALKGMEVKEWTEERTDKFWGSEKYWEESVKRTIVHTREKNDLQYQLCNRFV